VYATVLLPYPNWPEILKILKTFLFFMIWQLDFMCLSSLRMVGLIMLFLMTIFPVILQQNSLFSVNQ